MGKKKSNTNQKPLAFNIKVVPFEMCCCSCMTHLLILKADFSCFSFTLHFSQLQYSLKSKWRAFADKLVSSVHIVDNHGNLLVTKATSQGSFCCSIVFATSPGDSRQPAANTYQLLGNTHFSPATQGCKVLPTRS